MESWFRENFLFWGVQRIPLNINVPIDVVSISIAALGQSVVLSPRRFISPVYLRKN